MRVIVLTHSKIESRIYIYCLTIINSVGIEHVVTYLQLILICVCIGSGQCW